jgi:hypothetical protein
LLALRLLNKLGLSIEKIEVLLLVAAVVAMLARRTDDCY